MILAGTLASIGPLTSGMFSAGTWVVPLTPVPRTILTSWSFPWQVFFLVLCPLNTLRIWGWKSTKLQCHKVELIGIKQPVCVTEVSLTCKVGFRNRTQINQSPIDAVSTSPPQPQWCSFTDEYCIDVLHQCSVGSMNANTNIAQGTRGSLKS